MTRREANARSDPRWAFHESISEVKRKRHKHGSEGNTDRVCTARGRPTSRAKLWKVSRINQNGAIRLSFHLRQMPNSCPREILLQFPTRLALPALLPFHSVFSVMNARVRVYRRC